ncbi:MAG: tetratricopeptide repeat protein [Bacteroidia bacterium]
MKKILFLFLIVSLNVFSHDTVSTTKVAITRSLSGLANWKSMQQEALSYALATLDSAIKSGDATYETYFDRASVNAVIGDQNAALKDYGNAIAKKGNGYEALVNRSVLLMGMHRYSESMKDIEKLITLYPDSSILYNNRGFLLQDEHKYTEAISDYSKSASLDKEYINPRANRIRCYVLLNDKKNARKYCDELLAEFPKNPDIYTELSDFYRSMNELPEAMDYLNRAIKVSNGNPEMYIARARFKDDVLNDDEDALRDCDTAIAKAPQNAQAYFARTGPLFDMKKYPEIIRNCEKAISLDSTFYEAWVMRGDAYDLSGNTQAAWYNYDIAIRMQPKNEGAYVQAVSLYTARSQFKTAIAVLNRLLEAVPYSIKGLSSRAELSVNIGDFKTAKKDYLAITDLEPDDPAPWYYLALALDSLGEKTNICKYMKRSYELSMNDEQEEHGLSQPHIYMLDHCRDLLPKNLLPGDDLVREMVKDEAVGDWKGCVGLLDKFLVIYPDSAFFYYIRGKDKRKMEQFEDAIVDYKKALALNPNIPDATVSLGVALQHLGNTTEAMEYYKKTIELSPGNEMPYNNIGSILLDQKKYAEALNYFKKAVSLKPDYITALMQLGECYEDMGDKLNACMVYKKAEAFGDGAAKSKRIFTCN